MIYDFRAPDADTMFEKCHADHKHHFTVTRRDRDGRSITRFNTYQECVAQLIGITRILNKSPHENICADQHTFKFWPTEYGIRIKCETPDDPDDEYEIAWAEGV